MSDDARRAVRVIFETFALRAEDHSIHIDLSIPVGAGLGSSAAMAVAVARAAAQLCELANDDARGRVDEAVAASESVFHGKASGIDQTAAMGAGFFAFANTHGWPEITPLDVPQARWIIARVAPSASTSKMVESVAGLHQRHRSRITDLFEQFGAIAQAGTRALTRGNWREVGTLMNINQGLLNAIGVSTPALETACDKAREAGAFGAKLTGAGGGGCVIAIADDERCDEVTSALEECGEVFCAELPPR